MQCERNQCALNRIECALPRSGFKPVRMRFDFLCSVNAPIESVDSISKDERGFPLTQYITNGRISRGGYTFTHFKHHHRVLRLISYRMGV